MVTRRLGVDSREYTPGTLFRLEPSGLCYAVAAEREREVESPHILIVLVSRTTLRTKEPVSCIGIHGCSLDIRWPGPVFSVAA